MPGKGLNGTKIGLVRRRNEAVPLRTRRASALSEFSIRAVFAEAGADTGRRGAQD
jgi:hypothetical protein